MSNERELLDRWNRAIAPFIPGGSEYIDDPERVAEAIKEGRDIDRRRYEKIIAKLRMGNRVVTETDSELHQMD